MDYPSQDSPQICGVLEQQSIFTVFFFFFLGLFSSLILPALGLITDTYVLFGKVVAPGSLCMAICPLHVVDMHIFFLEKLRSGI